MKILFLQKRLLFPTNTGGKIRTLNVVRHLARWHEVTYLCNVLPEEEAHLDRMSELGLNVQAIPWREASRQSPVFYAQVLWNLTSTYPFNVNKDYDVRLRETARKLVDEGEFDVVVCDFVQMARNIIGLKSPPKVLFQHNVEAEIFQRQMNASSGLKRALMRNQWRKMMQFESQAGREFDRIVAVSQRDREIFERDYQWDHVDVIDTAVDVEYFAPVDKPPVNHRVAFVGSMDWLPNQDGILDFVSQVWPLVRQRVPDATFEVIGRNPPASISSLDGQQGMRVLGTVPDVRPHLAEAQVVIVPLLVGGGTRLKIFEAMAMAKPVVSTSLGAEGLEVRSGEDIIIADGAEQFADAVVQLLDDPDRCAQLSESARQLVQERFSAETVAGQFDRILQDAVSNRGAS